MYGLQREGVGLHAMLVEISRQLGLGLLAASQELHRAVAMGADALTTPDKGLDGGIGQNGIQLGRLQGGRHGSHLTVEECLGLGHQTSQRLGIALGHKADGAVDNLKVFLTQRLVLLPLGLGGGEGIGLVQVGQYLDSILLGTEVGKYPVEVFLHVERAHLDLIAVEGHEVRLHTEGTGLVQTATTATGTEFTHIGDIHLAQGIEVEIIQEVEGAGHENTDGCRRGEAALHGERHRRDADAHTTHLIPFEHIGGHTGTVAEKAARLGDTLQLGLVHTTGEILPHATDLRGVAIEFEDARLLDFGIDTLFNTRHDGGTRFDVGVHCTIVSSPVCMFSKKAQAPRNE